ncbi:MAG: hypothetical protein HRU19_29225 [Pseudobacteriovorax sp.]|nr:hypothetical protein [Pseudobacteriovorax sp.]
MDEVKRLPTSTRLNIKEQSWARRRIGLKPIKVVIRNCRICDVLFETVSERTCEDCKKRIDRSTVAALQGFEVI